MEIYKNKQLEGVIAADESKLGLALHKYSNTMVENTEGMLLG